jgi:adenylylsulfate kinase
MSWALWVTGVPGSGKSTLARAAAQQLRASDTAVHVLELDEVRKFLTPAPTYSDAERDVVYRGLVYLARTLAEAGRPVIIDATAHRRAWRDLARASIPRFAEVQLVCPTEHARQRERARTPGHAPQGIYDRAGRPGATVPGVDVAYEPALAPELIVDTTAVDVPAAVEKIVRLASTIAQSSPALTTMSDVTWALWITGLPGSGKTTLAWTVAERLIGRGVPVRVVDAAEARMVLLEGRPGSRTEEDVLHRTIVYAAKLLTELGTSALIDATAPRRLWRDMARAAIARFAEVQLVCPREVCQDRERAVRWHLAPCGPMSPVRSPAGVGPDIVLDYEESLRPELVVHTDVQHETAAADEIFVVALRLTTRHEDEPSPDPRVS